MWLADVEYANQSLEEKSNSKHYDCNEMWIIGTEILNEETMHAIVGDAKGHSQNCYTRCGIASMALDPP